MTQLILWTVLILLVLPIAALAVLHHSLVQARLACQESWTQLTGVLKGRLALVPHLLQLAEEYAAAGQDVCREVRAARKEASQARGVQARGQAETRLVEALAGLFDLAERYPGLKSHTEFARLREELRSAENRIGLAADDYNSRVRSYNDLRERKIHGLLARAMKLKPVHEFPDAAVRTENC
ncbi:MAG: LemA family protein [Phycisphaerae bacterium]